MKTLIIAWRRLLLQLAALMFPLGAAAITVEQPSGTFLTSNTSVVNFGSSVIGTPVPLTFTIKNNGTSALTSISLTRDGGNPGDFTITTAPVTPLMVSASTTFVVTFNPAASGNRSAVLHINTIPTSGSTFNINLMGTGQAALSSAKDILSFSFGGLGAATISGTAISMNVPYGTVVTNLVPTYTVSTYASGSPASGTARNFTTPQTFTITAQDATTQVYTVTVTVASAAPPVVSTSAVSGLSASGVTLRGSVIPNSSGVAGFEYGFTTGYGNDSATQDINGVVSVNLEAALTSLKSGTLYHYRAYANTGSGRVYGADMTFTTLFDLPLAVTSSPSSVTSSGATLRGSINPNGLAAQVRFVYGLTTLYGSTTTMQNIPAGTGIVDISAAISGLVSGATYHYRIIATTSAGTRQGSDVSFVATTTSGPGSPTGAPSVTTGATSSVTTSSAELLGSVNPNDGNTMAQFEYGMTTSYGHVTSLQSAGNGHASIAVSLTASGLLAGTHYHYRLLGSNSLGTTFGADAEFTTDYSPPTVVSGAANATSTTSATVAGTVRARKADATVTIDYGTSAGLLTNSCSATPGTVTGDTTTAISADLTSLVQGTTYYYQVRATNAGGTGTGDVRSFDVGVLSGLFQLYPGDVPEASRQGSLTINLTPGGIGGGWRFVGEQQWRSTAATGLTAGDRVVEYRPVAGYTQPSDETVVVVDGGSPITLSRGYTASGGGGTGGLTVTLQPPSLSGAQWRLYGETDLQWKNSGVTVSSLIPGDYVIECKSVTNRTTPSPVTASVSNGATTLATCTYYVAEGHSGTPPGGLTFTTVGAHDRPYAFVGQITSDVGVSTGFVVKQRVVATAGHVVFDDGTLSAATGLRWYFQRHSGTHEPLGQIPRGYYLMSGYAEQRAADNSPGTSSPQSQNLDAAALYFLSDAGRGGYSGYLASDSMVNEFVVSSAMKTLVGYPVEGIVPANQGLIHSTPVANVTFSSAYGQTYTTSDIYSSGGNSGGPLCVQHSSGVYYPAAIYLGGSSQMVVRAINSEVVNLFGFADNSANAGVGSSGGGVTQTDTTVIASPGSGALQVLIEPAAARAAGAGWRLQSSTQQTQTNYSPSGFQLGGITPNSYTVQFSEVPGFLPPAPQSLVISEGQLTTITYTYSGSTAPPSITSPDAVTVPRGQTFTYQITASNSPGFFTLMGSLPPGLVFYRESGIISGIPQLAGVFPVTVGAVNEGGAASRLVKITVLPALAPQTLSAVVQQPVNYRIISSEYGDGVYYSANYLPQGLYLNNTLGMIFGMVGFPGTYQVPISVTKGGATAMALLTINVTYPLPVFTQQPIANKSIKYGMNTTLTATASTTTTGLDGFTSTTTYQWYQGQSGDTTNPVQGATGPTLTTTALTANTMYWVRATNRSSTGEIIGYTDSAATTIQVLPSSNANLANLRVSQGTLSPVFNPGILAYTVNVPYSVPNLSVRPDLQVDQSYVAVNGMSVTSGSFSEPINLLVGRNVISVDVKAGDGLTRKNYLITVMRASPPAVTTHEATDVTGVSATLNGSVVPNGTVSAFFQYGRDTSYGKTTNRQTLTGAEPVPVQAALSGLSGSGTYHFRLVVMAGTDVLYGADMSFATVVEKPLVATGSPIIVDHEGELRLTLVGGVNTRNLNTNAYFKIGMTASCDSVTPNISVNASSSVQDVLAENVFTHISPALPMTPGATYYYRIVATSAAGTSEGDVVSFTMVAGGGGSASTPTVTTGSASDETSTTVNLHGQVNPNEGTTFVYFEYGQDASYGSATLHQGIGNGGDPVNVTLAASTLLPGTLYHYRCVGENSTGTTLGSDATFTTSSLPPTVTTGIAAALTSSSVTVHATVQANGASTTVYFDYGSDGVTFPHSVLATGSPVTGHDVTAVSATIIDLIGKDIYYFRVRGTNSGGTTNGSAVSFQVNSLLGLLQQFTQEVAAEDYQGEVQVNLLPDGIGGWRFVGETEWRVTGATATSLTTGDREIEYQPVAGYIQPQKETVGVVSGEPLVALERLYYDAGAAGTGVLHVTLKPDAIANAVLEADRAQWRLAGDASAAWRNSGDDMTGILPGSYLVECKGISGRSTPTPMNVMVVADETASATITYFAASDPAATLPTMVSFETASTSQDMPYAFVGLVRSGLGSYSGFAVKSRVVVTAAQAVFDEDSLAATSSLQWMLQRDKDYYEPAPLTPRGFYAFDGYATQRTSEATPGALASQSQNRNVAALYFDQDAGRSGYSGFLASETTPNTYLNSSALKMLVGYPTEQVASADLGRMHATSAANATFTQAYERVYSTTDIQGIPGMIGGPLCVQYEGGAYYPAAVYVGGITGSAVRAIDIEMVDLFTRAATSGNGGANDSSGGITHSGFTVIGDPADPGAIKVTIEPSGARDAGAGWRLKPEVSYVASGTQKNGLTPGSYILQLSTVGGYQEPTEQTVTITGGQLLEVTFTYDLDYTALELWRLANFGTPSNSGNAADSADPDGDGKTNIQEYVAATDPNSYASVFKVLTVSKTSSTFSLTAAGKASHSYVLERRASISSGTWTDIDSEGPLGADGTITLSDSSPLSTAGFYRVRVEPP